MDIGGKHRLTGTRLFTVDERQVTKQETKQVMCNEGTYAVWGACCFRLPFWFGCLTMARDCAHGAQRLAEEPIMAPTFLSLPRLAACRCETRLGFSLLCSCIPFSHLSLLLLICTIMCRGNHMSIYPHPLASLSCHTPPLVFTQGKSQACVSHVCLLRTVHMAD